MDKQRVDALARSDLAHFIHPQHHVSEHQDPVIYVKGEGAVLTDAQGRQYIDGLSCLWNVAVGHGRRELAEVAAQRWPSWPSAAATPATPTPLPSSWRSGSALWSSRCSCCRRPAQP